MQKTLTQPSTQKSLSRIQPRLVQSILEFKGRSMSFPRDVDCQNNTLRTFKNLPQGHWVNLNQTSHKVPLDKRFSKGDR